MFNKEKGKIQDETINALEKNNFNGIFILPTGTGKGRVIAECLKKLRPKGDILYLCDNKNLRDKDFPFQMLEWKAEGYLKQMIRMCYAGSKNMTNNHFELLIADECDYGATPEYSKVFFNNTFDHKILCSATLYGEKRTLLKRIVPIVYEKKLSEAEKTGALNKSKYFWVNYVMDESEQTQYKIYNKKFVELIARKSTQNPSYIDMLCKRLSNERRIFLSNLDSSVRITRKLIGTLNRRNPSTRALIFFNSREQANNTMPYTYHGGNEKEDWLEKFRNKEINWLGVIGKIDRGVNLPDVDTIIMESCPSSPSKAIQRFGRAKRLDTEEFSNVYFIVPHFYKTPTILRPTKIRDWILTATKDVDLSKACQFSFKDEILLK